MNILEMIIFFPLAAISIIGSIVTGVCFVMSMATFPFLCMDSGFKDAMTGLMACGTALFCFYTLQVFCIWYTSGCGKWLWNIDAYQIFK